MKRSVLSLIAIILGGTLFVVSRRCRLGFALDIAGFTVLFAGLLFMTVAWVKNNPPNDSKNGNDPLL